MFIDKKYENIGVKDSLWVYDKEDIKREDMIYPTDLCEEIRSYLIDKLTLVYHTKYINLLNKRKMEKNNDNTRIN